MIQKKATLSQKKALIVTTKGWSKDELRKFEKCVDKQNYRWRANVLTKDGKKNFCYFRSKVDLEIMAIQLGFTILKVVKI